MDVHKLMHTGTKREASADRAKSPWPDNFWFSSILAPVELGQSDCRERTSPLRTVAEAVPHLKSSFLQYRGL